MVPPIFPTTNDLTNLFSRISFNNYEPSVMHVDHGGLDHSISNGLNVKEKNKELKKNAMKELKESYNLDGLNCAICYEHWTLDGDHHVSCLPCGHIFGLSCINKWIQLRRMQAKCPQCNVRIGPNGVTKLYASPVVLVEEEDQQKKVEISKAKDLEKENSNLLLIQDTLLKELRLLKKQVSTGTVNLEDTQRNTSSLTAELVNETQKVFKFDAKVDTRRSRRCNFVLKHEMSVESAHLFDMDVGYKTLLLARRVQGMGGRHVLEKINMMNPQRKEEIILPAGTKAVKDLHISPCGRLALFASLGKKLSIISMGGNSIVVTYDLPMPAWSCLWDNNSSNYMYAGLQNGMLLVFDMRHTIRPVESIQGLDSRPIHTIHPFEHNTSHPHNTTQLLTASSCGPCLWNMNGGLQRTASSFYFKSGSASAQLGYEWITKSTFINIENCHPMFAYGNDVSNGLRLLEIPSLDVTHNLKPHQHPILDVKYSQSQGSGVAVKPFLNYHYIGTTSMSYGK
ncbi:E3 ubiquitin-protein ligase RFWD3 [Artemisia annua]|uniref:RING-type E3 ubiquitin transferase n=1 Tax=Artemisia annua TaxID=35608 RepID=A0A2U1KQB8_ARTAN|nr:E3 ubiquitin-protein ligase RFWD3 [Artemisia annua]